MEEEADVKPTKIRSMAIVPGINPFEVFLLLSCILISIARLFGLAAPGSLAAVLPVWAISLWYVNLGIGAVVGLYGGLVARKVWPGQDEGALRSALATYAIGWLYVGTASVTYGTLLLLLFPTAAAAPGTTTVAWGIASLFRAGQVRRLLRLKGGGTHRHV